MAEAEVQVAALQRLLRPRHRRLAVLAPAELQVLRPANIIQRLASLSPQLQQNSKLRCCWLALLALSPWHKGTTE